MANYPSDACPVSDPLMGDEQGISAEYSDTLAQEPPAGAEEERGRVEPEDPEFD